MSRSQSDAAVTPRAAAGPAPHASPSQVVAAALGVDPATGLRRHEVAERRSSYGPNELERVTPPSLLRLLWEGAREPFIVLLFIAGVLAIALGEVRDGLLVLVILAPIVGAGVITEYRSERALEALRAAAAPTARVRREGEVLEVAAADLVPGDVVLLRVGDVVPADLRIVRADGLTFDRSVLTGESLPDPASAEADAADAAIADRHSMAYAGTSVVGGRGEAIVVAIGLDSEFGRISRALADRERRRSPLQRELDRLVRILLFVAIGLIAIVTTLGFIRGLPAGKNLLAGVSAAIAAIPEEPPALIAVILGLGAYRLLRMGVLVRRLTAQETLGSVDLILTDKTGTLTENRLALTAIRTPAGAVEQPELRAALALDALRAEEDAWSIASGAKPGSFTRSLLHYLEPLGVAPELDPVSLVEAEPAGEDRPYSRTRAARDGAIEELALGAPEAVLALAEASRPPTGVPGAPIPVAVATAAPGSSAADGEVERLRLEHAAKADREDLAAWHALVDQGARAGERLLLLAARIEEGPWRPRALLGFSDPLRAGIPDSMALASRAGIQTLVVTGDHPRTAGAIAAAAGLRHERIVTGEELESWDDARLDAELPTLDIVARAIPEQKLRLVDAARKASRTVAVTGDGVNDAPALQHADVAVAMGSGTAVAREASDLVLGDDSFVTLMHGLREGRRLVANVQKGLVFLISTHVAMLGFILIATIAGFNQPLLPIQILWLEVFIDLLTAVSFEGEAEEPDAMDRPPRPRTRPLLDREMLLRIALAGGFSAVAALVLIEQHPGGFDHARWLAYTALVLGQVVRANANRRLSHPVIASRPNPLLLGGAVVVVALQVVIPLVPPLADAFRATVLDPVDWLLVVLVALTPAVFAEAYRAVRHRPWVA